MKKEFCIFVFLLLCFSPVKAWEYAELRRPPFTIRYVSRDAAFARWTAALLGQSLNKLKRDLGLEDVGRPVVVIAPDESEFLRLAGTRFPHWGAAMAAPDRNLILLKSPYWADVRRSWSSLTAHELTHLALYHITRGRPLPVWLNEGLAVYESDEMSMGRKAAVSRALLTRRLLPLGSLGRLYTMGAMDASLAYSEALLAVEFFLQRYGKAPLIYLLIQIGQNQDFEAAFRTVAHEDFSDFEKAWKHWLQRRYFFYFFMDVEMYVWTFILFLAVAAFVAVRLRKRSIEKRWREEEEEGEPPDFDPFDW